MRGGSSRQTSEYWFSEAGNDNDVVLSTRVRLARNLANFPFPAKLRPTDGTRIQSIVFDAFNRLDDGEQFQSVSVRQLNTLGNKVLQERGILDAATDCGDCGIVMRSDGKVSCTVNVEDHVRIASFAPGLDFDGTLAVGRRIDAGLQKSIQFAASYDFGYLTSSVLDAGSGMKLSLRVHLPGITLLGKIGSLGESLGKKGFTLTATYGPGNKGASLGAFYQISSTNSFTGSEFDQVASLSAAGMQITEQERAAREQCARSLPTILRNEVFRAYALAKFSKMVPLREAIEIVSGLHLGLSTGLLSGADDSAIHTLLYRIQEAHLEFAIRNGEFPFEDDVEQELPLKVNRLRQLVLQEVAEQIGPS